MYLLVRIFYPTRFEKKIFDQNLSDHSVHMMNRLVCPYSKVHLNNNPHISGKEKNRDCNCANIVKDPEMEILKIQNSEKAQEKIKKCWDHVKIYSLEDRKHNGLTKSLLGASSSTKITILGTIAIPSGKSSQLKPHTGTEFHAFSSNAISTNSMTSQNSSTALEGTIKALLRPQNSKNVNKLQSSKIQSHAGKEALTLSSGFTTVHRKRTTDSYSDVLTQLQPSMEGSSLTSAVGGLNSASLNE
jgi:hypothetical protein